MNKKQLYNKIIQRVSKIVKKSINEAFNFNDINTKSKNKTLVKNAIDNAIKYRFNEILNKILKNIQLTPEENGFLFNDKCKKLLNTINEPRKLLEIILNYLITNKNYELTLDWIDFDKVAEENEWSPQERYIMSYIPTKDDIEKTKKFLNTLKKIDQEKNSILIKHINKLSPKLYLRYRLAFCIQVLDQNNNAFLWDWKYKKLNYDNIPFDGAPFTDFIKNEYILYILIKILSIANSKNLKIKNALQFGFDMVDNNNYNLTYNAIYKIFHKLEKSEISSNWKFSYDSPLNFVFLENPENVDDIFDKIIKFAEAYVNEFNKYAKKLNKE